MTRVIEKTVYTIQELSESARQKALNDMRINLVFQSESDWEFVLDDAKTIGALMGIDIDKVYFSGFSSQGDGACFVGEYRYKRGSVKAMVEYAPQDTELHQIVKDLYLIQARNFFGLTASVKHRGRYSDEMSTDISIYGSLFDPSSDTCESLKDALRDFMRWIYKQLEREYEYQNSEKCLLECCDANGYEFDEDGNLV